MQHYIVLDVGKTQSKLSLWTADGTCVTRISRANAVVEAPHYRALDVEGITAWLTNGLRDFAARADIAAIIPVGHGAGVAALKDGALAYPVMDYEQAIPEEVLADYRAQRDAFAQTGSPALPAGLNFGAQLHWAEALYPDALNGAILLPWAQYWAWVLSGVAASEVSSLGCHADLWCPEVRDYSTLAKRRGWAARIAPIRHAGDSLGPITSAWAQRTGLSTTCQIHCGVHDSNAALVAARGLMTGMAGGLTTVSTGTWFIAMRSGAAAHITLPEGRDCLVNVDIDGVPTPSARFMGGRELEVLLDGDAPIDVPADQPALLAKVEQVLSDGAMILPGFAPGCGPFPETRGSWVNRSAQADTRRAAIALYAALMVDVMLDLLGADGSLLIEGRFASSDVFIRALASLRPNQAVYKANAENDVSFGALRLLLPQIMPRTEITQITPLAEDLHSYKSVWRNALV